MEDLAVLLAIIYLLMTLVVGWLGLSFVKERLTGVERLSLCFPLGFAITVATSFAFALFLHLQLGLLFWIVIAAAVVVALRDQMSLPTDVGKLELAVLIIALLIAGFNFTRIQLDFYSDGGYMTSDTAFSDLMLHNGMVSAFAYGDNYPPEEPYLSGYPLHYHFLINFYSGALRYGGLPFQIAFVLPEVLLFGSAITILYFITKRLTGRRSAAIFAIAMLLFNGNLAILNVYNEQLHQSPEQLGKAISDLYAVANGYFGSDEVLSALGPLRALAAGLPVFAAGLLLILVGLPIGKKTGDDRALALAGLAAGAGPLIQGFTFPCLMICGFVLTLIFAKDKIRSLAFFLVPGLLLGGAEFLFIFSTGTPVGYPKINIFYMADTLQGAITSWARNWSPFLAFLLCGLAFAPKWLKYYYLAPLGLFVLLNTVQYQPFEIDNQILFLWYLASIPLAALFLSEVWGRGKIGMLVAVMLLVASMASGALVWYYHAQTRYQVYSDADMAFADWMIKNTPPDSVVLTAQSHTHPATVLAGRKMLVTIYAYNVGRGLNELVGKPVMYDERVAAMHEIYTGGPGAADALRTWKINYVIVGPYEQGMAPPVNPSFFEASPLFEKVLDQDFGNGEWRVYHVK